MVALLGFFLTLFASPFKSKSRLEAENAVLRLQLAVLRRKVRGRVQLTNGDRLFLIYLYRWFPSVSKAITIIRPETLVRWHRAGFRRYWRWKARPLGGRPQIGTELRALILRMSVENLLWGAPRIHGELRKLGFEVAQSSVAKYIVKRQGPPSQGWRTFLRDIDRAELGGLTGAAERGLAAELFQPLHRRAVGHLQRCRRRHQLATKRIVSFCAETVGKAAVGKAAPALCAGTVSSRIPA